MTDESRRPDEGANVDPAGVPADEAVPTCYRHPDRESYIRCQRCDRYICPDCQRQASVGFQCVECVREGQRDQPAARTRFGGVIRGNDGVVTKVILGINIVIFVLGMLSPALIQWMQLVGRIGFADQIGAAGGVAGGEVWRLITSVFVHVQIWHLAVNMFTLWILGPPLERLLGRARFTALYLVAGLTGSAVAYAFTDPRVGVVGASGALFGLFGATVMLSRKMKADMSWFLGTLAINVVINVLFARFLSWQGHLGGFIGGLLLGAALAYAPRERRDLYQILGFVGVGLLAIGLIVWRTASLV
ncbi:rhomboid family intramembrane serine protease [Tenggerimyces flavus]|uniref:Rhomboid family intramembrane serine protease n=1 Tax=Tenggerimyces flavus TaxID=1708749 RepID=A0ABV7YPG9_9ACTN|nr:rhomboid family intramembrane serine protease [Tenggerimyces flavus]MBM7784409.1 membrane associated rhomboid family serine protease [Tenggerimyces flavus]